MDIRIVFSAVQTMNGPEVVFEEQTRQKLEEFFSSTDNDLEVEAINTAIMRRRLPYDEYSMFCKYLLLDLKSENSCIIKKFELISIEDKVNFFFRVFPLRFDCDRLLYDNAWKRYIAFYGRGKRHFHVCYPKEYLLEEYYSDSPLYAVANNLSDDDFLRGILVFYYREIAAYDRAALRADSKEMAFLQENWIKSLLFELA